MKKLILSWIVLLAGGAAWAFDLWQSSSPVAATGGASVAMLCPETQRGVLHGICTNFGTSSSSTTIVNSTWTLSGVMKIGPVTTFAADQCKYYDAFIGNGMGYNKPNTAVVTILYQCY